MSGTRSLIRHSSLIRHLNPSFDSARVTRITRQSLISNRWKERVGERRKKYMEGKEKKENERERERLSLCGCPTMVRRKAARLISSGQIAPGQIDCIQPAL